MHAARQRNASKLQTICNSKNVSAKLGAVLMQSSRDLGLCCMLQADKMPWHLLVLLSLTRAHCAPLTTKHLEAAIPAPCAACYTAIELRQGGTLLLWCCNLDQLPRTGISRCLYLVARRCVKTRAVIRLV